MANAQPMYHIDPTLLESNEVEYEDMIRPATGDTPGQGAVLLVGRVVQKMHLEKALNTDPLSLGTLSEATNEEIVGELALCRQRLKELAEQTRTQLIVVATRLPLDNPPRIKSRALHYEYRLKRIPQERLDATQAMQHELLTESFESLHGTLEALIEPNSEGYAVVRAMHLNTTANSEIPEGSGLANSTMNGEQPNGGTSQSQTTGPPVGNPAATEHAPNGPTIPPPQPATRSNRTNVPNMGQENGPDDIGNDYRQHSATYADRMGFMANDARRSATVAFDSRPPATFQYTAAEARNHFNPFVSVRMTPEEAALFGGRNDARPAMEAPEFPRGPSIPQQTGGPNLNPSRIPPHNVQQQRTQPPQTQQTQQAAASQSFNVSHDGYHPATTPYPYRRSEDPLNLNGLPIHQGNAPPMNMNPCQAQQFLGRILANRKYEGYQTDQKQFVPLDEFVSLVKQYKVSTGYDDKMVLSQVSTFMTGSAFTWWQANSRHIRTLEELESRLRTRFERQATDPISIVLEFASRKQGKEEDLLDYIDDMKQRLMRCPDFPEEQAVEKIVDNTNEVYNRILAARPFSSIDHLSRHAEYLMRNKPRRSAQPNKTDKRPIYSRPRVYAIENTQEGTEEEPCELETVETWEECGDKDMNEVLVADFAAILTKMNNRFRHNTSGKPQKQTEKHRPSINDSKQLKAIESDAVVRKDGPVICTNCMTWGHNSSVCKQERKVRCFGCGAEGVYKSQCDNCNSPNPKNSSA